MCNAKYTLLANTSNVKQKPAYAGKQRDYGTAKDKHAALRGMVDAILTFAATIERKRAEGTPTRASCGNSSKSAAVAGRPPHEGFPRAMWPRRRPFSTPPRASKLRTLDDGRTSGASSFRLRNTDGSARTRLDTYRPVQPSTKGGWAHEIQMLHNGGVTIEIFVLIEFDGRAYF